MKTKEKLPSAIKVLQNGGIVVFPTDTAFGVGCRMDNEKAVERLFQVRRRPESQAVPVLVSSPEMAEKYLQPLPNEVKNLMQKYWPGALTIIFSCKKERVSSLVRGGGETLGVRMPNHEIPLALINNLGVPILGPSANFHGQPTPHKYEELDPEFIKLVDYVFPGECPVAEASTVIDCSVKPWKIIRQGAIKLDEAFY